MNSPHIDTLRKHEPEIFKQFGIQKIGIFGSVVRGEDNLDSDIDILVEFSPEEKTFDNYMGLKHYLESLFKRKVDLVTTDGIHPLIRKNVLREVVYTAMNREKTSLEY